MAIGTLLSGDVKCDWCGKYMKNTDGGLTGAMGLDIVKRAASAGMKHYCSKSCKQAAEGSGGGGSATNEAAEQRMREESDAAEKKQGLAAIQNINFEGDAKSIVTSLGNLQTIASSSNKDSDGVKAVRKAAFKKIELGIRMLRSAGDAANAEYFEKELKGMKIKAFLTSPNTWAAAIAVVIALGILINHLGRNVFYWW